MQSVTPAQWLWLQAACVEDRGVDLLIYQAAEAAGKDVFNICCLLPLPAPHEME